MIKLNTKSLIGLVTGLVIAISLVSVAPALALTAAEFDMLAAIGVSADKIAALKVAQYANLTIGSKGAEVTALQQMLVAGGFLKMPAGVAYGYYGKLTADAYAAYKAAQVTTTTTGGSTSTSGSEGELDNWDSIGKISNEEVGEGSDDVKVLGVEVEAVDSDMSITRADVYFTAPTGATVSDDLEDYITEVGLMFDGKVVATLDVEDLDDDVTTYDYKARFSGLNIVVEEDKTAELYVVVSGVNSVDEDDTESWTVTLGDVRASDTAGISDTYTVDIEEDFSVETPDVSTLDYSFEDEDNEAETIEVTEDDSVEDVVVYTATLETEDGEVTLDDISVTFATSGAALSAMVEEVTLFIDGKEIDSESIGVSESNSGVVTFENMDLDLEGDEEFPIVVKVTVAEQGEDAENYASGSTFNVASVAVDYEDSEGDDDSITLSEDGGVMTLRANAVSVDFVSASSAITPVSGNEAEGRFFVTFKVTAPSDENIYITKGATTSNSIATSTLKGAYFKIVDGNGNAATATTSADSLLLTKVSGGTEVDGIYKITKGNTATFKLDVKLSNEGGSVSKTLGIELEGVNYQVGATSATVVQLTDGIDEDYRSDTATLQKTNE